ncbi:hypothetical protein AB0F81_22050 [Actinoplanes sp. NPDC024001]|uniref:hypothetical protein n=1 Tax=Actinoplanes sp. NPDC024001 TaxID=3154598 RepID=UPI0033DC0A44
MKIRPVRRGLSVRAREYGQGVTGQKNDRVEDVALLILQWLGEQGVDAMIRVDAERQAEGKPAWTFAASGGPLEWGMRADGRDARECMSRAVVKLRELGVQVPAGNADAGDRHRA